MNEAARAGARLLASVALAALGSVHALKLSTLGGDRGKSSFSPYRQTLQNYQNVQYYGDLLIGGQNIQGIFDTGSFELLARSTLCTACAHPTTPYNRSLSRTYVANGTAATHVYGSGPCSSVRGYESVQIGPMYVQHQSFYEILEHQIPPLDEARFAAIVGLGPNFAPANTEQTLLMSFGVTEFSICLQRQSLAPGYLTWGAEVDSAYKERHYAQAEVLGVHHWATTMGPVKMELEGMSSPITACPGGSCGVIVDSGTSLIAAPAEALAQLTAQLAPVMEDCSNLHLMPTLLFEINGIGLALPPEAYTMRITGAVAEADDIWDILFFRPRLRRTNMCMPAFMAIDMPSQFGPTWILGMPFFRYYHTTFDRAARKMYFAHSGPDCAPQPIFANGTRVANLVSRDQDLRRGPMEMDVKALVPPALSSLIDTSVQSVVL